jgi:predicted enzyme related to lactoylglutathione lyase
VKAARTDGQSATVSMGSNLVLGLHHVALPFAGTMEDVAAARHFYGSLIGLIELAVPVSILGVLWFDAGAGTQLHLYTDPDATLHRSPRHPALSVRELATLHDRLVANGVDVIEPPQDLPGRRRFFAVDPFGNAVEFVEFDEPVSG